MLDDSYTLKAEPEAIEFHGEALKHRLDYSILASFQPYLSAHSHRAHHFTTHASFDDLYTTPSSYYSAQEVNARK